MAAPDAGGTDDVDPYGGTPPARSPGGVLAGWGVGRCGLLSGRGSIRANNSALDGYEIDASLDGRRAVRTVLDQSISSFSARIVAKTVARQGNVTQETVEYCLPGTHSAPQRPGPVATTPGMACRFQDRPVAASTALDMVEARLCTYTLW